MNPVTSMTKALAVKLRTITGLTVVEGWPAPNQKLVMPSLTILKGKPLLTNYPVRELSKVAPVGVETTTAVKWVIGQWDVKFQLDLWARNQYERDAQFDLVLAKLKPLPGGALNLQLSDYHSIWSSFTLTDQEPVDDEAASQRQEWRLKLEVVGNCLAVLTSTEYAMIDLETVLTTPDTI